jgi:hypothetical protein
MDLNYFKFYLNFTAGPTCQLSLSFISLLMMCAAARYPCPPWPGPSTVVPRVAPSTPPPPSPTIPWTGPPSPPPSALSLARCPVHAARAHRAIYLGRSRRPRYSGSMPSPSFIAVEPVPATSSLAIRAPPWHRASEEPHPCSARRPSLLARQSRRSAMATSSSSVSHSSERTSPPWLSSRTVVTCRTEPELLIRANQEPKLIVPFVVPKPSELLLGRNPPQRRPSPRRRFRCSLLSHPILR